MTTPVDFSAVPFRITPRHKPVLATSVAFWLIGIASLASWAEAQTTSNRRPTSTSAYRSAATRAASPASGKATLASYVSDYAGEGQAQTAVRSAPVSQGAASASASPVVQSGSGVQPIPAGAYEEIGPGVPVGAVPGPAVAGGCDTCGSAGACGDGMPCWDAGDCYGGDCFPLFRPLRDRVWFRGEYLSWWLNGHRVPSLLTTSTDTDDAGILGRPTTRTLFGNELLNEGNRSGGRFTLGCWMDPYQDAGLEVTYIYLGDSTDVFESGLTSNSILARPFFDSGDGVESSWLLAQPGQLQGSATVTAKNQFTSLEALVRRRLFDDCSSRINMLVGYRYASLRDQLSINDHRVRTGTSAIEPIGTQIDQFDFFEGNNTFHGFEIGFVNEVHYNNWSLELLTKLALGNTRSEIGIDGHTDLTYNGTTTTTTGGLLTQATNIGQYQRDNFTVMPELGLTLGYDVTRHLRATVGYSFIYWSKVVRAGDQIDTNVNLPATAGQLPTGAQQPAASFKTTDFWAQGLNVGFQYNF